MIKSWPVTLAAAGTWPDAGTPGPNRRFNWIRIDNRGSGDVEVRWSPGDVLPWRVVKANKVRVFNYGCPRHGEDTPEDWPEKIYLSSSAGASLTIDVADFPLVDLVSATA